MDRKFREFSVPYDAASEDVITPAPMRYGYVWRGHGGAPWVWSSSSYATREQAVERVRELSDRYRNRQPPIERRLARKVSLLIVDKPEQHTIVIDGKIIPLSEESFKALKHHLCGLED